MGLSSNAAWPKTVTPVAPISHRPVAKGEAQAGVLLRPVTVAQILDIAHGGERMPPKSTFFFPKPRTGLLFRDLH